MTLDINTTMPFQAFRHLREIAWKAVGEASVLDLSQGEPGYGFSPSRRSRRCFAFILYLDSVFNDHFSDRPLFAYREAADLPDIMEEIKTAAHEFFAPEEAKVLLKDFEFLLAEMLKRTKAQGTFHTEFEILYQLFKYSNLSGGRYPEPTGQPILQSCLAEDYTARLGTKVRFDEIIPMLGASHGIGTVFKGLGEEAIKYLHAGDHVLMTSPVYAPYNALFAQRGIRVHSLDIDPMTGTFDPAQVEELRTLKDRLKCFILIDPNNPTGFGAGDDFFKAITELAETHNALVVTDEVYLEFFRDKRSLAEVDSLAKRLIRIDSLSKIERSTGLRVGNIYISKEANEFISNNILSGYLGDYGTVFDLMHLAKSPSGKNIGLFQHITGIPGPSAGLALCHILLGREEREATTDMIIAKVKTFYEILGLPYHDNLYYGMFNLRDLESAAWRDKTVVAKLEAIAKKGVVLMPANLFFSEEDRSKNDRTHMVRVSLPNLSLENTKHAATVIREVLAA